jgi:hypothetical protein
VHASNLNILNSDAEYNFTVRILPTVDANPQIERHCLFSHSISCCIFAGGMLNSSEYENGAVWKLL